MKKILAIILAAIVLTSMVACDAGGTNNPGVSNNNETVEGPVSTMNDAASKGSYTKLDAEDSQEHLVSMGLPEYSTGEILYGREFSSDKSGAIFINDTTLTECIDYCKSISGASPTYDVRILYFAKTQEKEYKLNGTPTKDVWQAEIVFTPKSGSQQGTQTPSYNVIAEGWELPEFPYGELVYTECDEEGKVVALYFNNVTIEDCHKYCLSIEALGYLEIFKVDIHEDEDGLGRWIDYIGMHPSTYNNYQVDYPSENMEHTVKTPNGEVAYQVIIRNRGK